MNHETKGREEETYLSFKPFFATPEDLSVLSAGLMEEGKKGGKEARHSDSSRQKIIIV